MEFGKHIGKGLWGFADKMLAVIYGLGFIFLVIRVLPEHEYGSFVIIQAIFTLITAVGTSFALQPLIKFASETDDYGQIITSSFFLHIGFLTLASILIIAIREPLALLFDSTNASYLSSLFLWVPLLIVASFIKSFLVSLLQTRFQVAKIFWIDSVFFLGSIILFFLADKFSLLRTARDVIFITLSTQILSTIFSFILSFKLLKFSRTISKDSFSKIFNFGKYSFASSVSFSLYAQLDIFLLSTIGGVVQVAIYSAAKIFIRIFDVFNQVIQLFIVPASSKLFSKNDFKSLQVLIEKSILFSTLALLPIFLLLVFGADFLIDIFYKGRYAEAGTPLRIFGILALLTPWYSVLPSILVGIGKVKEGLFISWIFIISSLVLFLVFIPLLGASGAAITLVIASIILSFSSAIAVNKSIKIRIKQMVSRTGDIKEFIKHKMIKPNEE